MVREHGVDVVFTEPSGIVIPFELRNAIANAGRDIRVSAGPVVLLLNAADPAAPFAEHVAHVTRQQVEQSDIVVVTKGDAAVDGGVECLRGAVRDVAPEIPVHVVSLTEGGGVEDLTTEILDRAAAG